MKGIAIGTSALLLMLGTIAPLFADDGSVKVYFRGDGTYVQRHMRSAPGALNAFFLLVYTLQSVSDCARRPRGCRQPPVVEYPAPEVPAAPPEVELTRFGGG